MKYPNETEEQFLKRAEEAKSHGECVFRDDANREFILDIIDEYIDVLDSVTPKQTINDTNSKKWKIRRN